MRQRFHAALAAYAALGVLACFTLDGKIRAAVLIFLGGMALKTVIAFKSGRAAR